MGVHKFDGQISSAQMCPGMGPSGSDVHKLPAVHPWLEGMESFNFGRSGRDGKPAPFTPVFSATDGIMEPPPISGGGAAPGMAPESSLPRVAAAFRRRGSKYFVSGIVAGHGLDAFVDSGADLSLTHPDDVSHLSKKRLGVPFEVQGFSGSSKVTITHSVDMCLDLCPGRVKGRFYLCDTPCTIIGSDLLRD